VATRIIMPKLGMAMKEGMLAQWSASNGQPVALDDTIAVIVTKKITYELKAPVAGILHHRVREQENRPVGAVIGYIAAPDEAVPVDDEGLVPPEFLVEKEVSEKKDISAPLGAAPAAPIPAQGGPIALDSFVVASPAARRMAREAGIELQFVCGTGPDGRVTEQDVLAYLEKLEDLQATSAARKLAQTGRVDLTRLTGSGPGGRITEADVQNVLTPPAEIPPASPPAPKADQLPGQATVPASVVPIRGMRQMIAENMVQSLQNTAQVTITTEIDVTELVDLRELLKKSFPITYTDLIIKAVVLALHKHPRLNARQEGEEIHLLDEIHIGVGVALDEGLIVPVIPNADRLTLPEIGEKVRDLAQRARSDSLDFDEVSGSTFTITNLGAYGIDAFTPIINPPEMAILGVGRINEKAAIFRGEIARRSMMVLSLTFDHRLVDGAPAAAFLQSVAEYLAHPYFLKDS
jgi:pyruvate dehydrogenase E2 component (dihydrolipoamide acetyltransferase)